jgi:Chaperone of endosialidase
MKIQSIIVTIITFVMFTFNNSIAQGHFRVRNDAFVQVGYETYKTLSLGQGDNSPNNGRFALEYWAGGLNFWKPWPTSNASNFNLFLRDDGNAAIGSSGDSNFKLDVAGDCRCGSWTSNSDRRFKSNILPVESALEKLLLLKPVTYQLGYAFSKYNISREGLPEAKLKTMESDSLVKVAPNDRIGLIAQDVESVFPQLVTKDDKGFLSVNYLDLVPVLIEGIKELQNQILDLKKQVAALKK